MTIDDIHADDITKDTHVCLECGHREKYGLGLKVDYDGLNSKGKLIRGTYCMKCWATWISENIPKMKEIQ